jgi:hypothetical protein
MARVSRRVQEINGILKPDDKACWVVDKYVTFRGDQIQWLDQTKELRNYIFQTSTQDTTNKQLPWKNSTSVPKLTQHCSPTTAGSSGKQGPTKRTRERTPS